jgi:hypothetical protein
MEEMTLILEIGWAQDPTALCADQPIIPAANFEQLSKDVQEYDEVELSEQEAYDLFTEQAKRFSGCGANNSERYGVLRKNPKTGWQYLVDLLIKKPE